MPTFKPSTLHISPYQRPQSPIQPVIEPLSPRGPVEPSFNCPPVSDSQWLQHQRESVAGPGSGSRNGTFPKQELSQSRRTPTTIDDLAEAALVHNPPYGLQTRKASATTSTAPYAAQHTGHKWSTSSGAYQSEERPAKRARSEAGPSSATGHSLSTGPSSSYLSDVAARDAEGKTDHHTRRESATSNLEDAALLLNFASNLAPRPHESLPGIREAAAQAPLASSPLVAPTRQTSLRADSDPTTSLPSPSETIEETSQAKQRQRSNGGPINHTKLNGQIDSTTSGHHAAPQQTQTPPEDEQSSEILRGIESAVHHESRTSDRPATPVDHSAVPEADHDKPKQKRGWPKGKPRGPRKTGVLTKPRQTTARRSRRSGAKTKSDENDIPPLPRRKSEIDISIPHGELSPEPSSRAASVPPDCRYTPGRLKAGRKAVPKVTQDTICAACQKSRNSSTGEHDQWISCNGCKKWLHSDCAGFKNERDVRDVDKFFCKTCEPKHGPTTFVRKSTRAHIAVDYAGLNQGVLRTSDDCIEHHYVQPIKDGTFKFDPEYFPRLRPELVTREYFERSALFSEPVLVPAEFNPPRRKGHGLGSEVLNSIEEHSRTGADEVLDQDFEYVTVPDDGQDKLGMIIPQDLTVRKVCELVGPYYPLEVIDVKEQGTSGTWNLQKWADYYDMEGEKEIRNVISLEVSDTKLGRLLRRPKLVRDIDLQDNVWPKDEPAKSVAFYCLMSAADSYTDFHIDFGGSSVYYHILRGNKTFLFIPPKPKHLKAYEDWNNSPQQNFTFLPDITKECYRVDLSEGDTMLIPSGWIHAVWTPANSLVIGGNFLTHMHYSMQFRVSDVEKANKTPLKFRYPKFQKVMWYSVIKYLEKDPLPESVRHAFYQGQKFRREHPTWQSFDEHGVHDESDSEQYNARYYSQMELDGLPELVSFIFRTVMIQLDRIEGITEETRKNVVRSIPKSHGEPLEVARTFALWVAWKRGNEDPPAWAHPDAVLPEKEGAQAKRLSARMLKQMQRQEAIEAYRVVAPDRLSVRRQEAAAKAEADAQAEAEALARAEAEAEVEVQAKAQAEAQARAQAAAHAEVPVVAIPQTETETQAVPQTISPPSPPEDNQADSGAQYTSTPKTSVLGPKRVACDACRKRRIRCKHKDAITTSSTAEEQMTTPVKNETDDGTTRGLENEQSIDVSMVDDDITAMQAIPQQLYVAPQAHMIATPNAGPPPMLAAAMTPVHAITPSDSTLKRGRSKACTECRKSKRRCIHDDSGRVDPVKEKQIPVARGAAPKKRKSLGDGDDDGSPEQKRSKQSQINNLPYDRTMPPQHTQETFQDASFQPNMSSSSVQDGQQYAQPADTQFQQDSVYPDPLESSYAVQTSNGPYHTTGASNGYNLPSLQQFANEVLDFNGGPMQQSHIHPDLRGDVQTQAKPVQSPSMLNGLTDGRQMSNNAINAPIHHESVDSGVLLPESTPSKTADTARQPISEADVNRVERPVQMNGRVGELSGVIEEKSTATGNNGLIVDEPDRTVGIAEEASQAPQVSGSNAAAQEVGSLSLVPQLSNDGAPSMTTVKAAPSSSPLTQPSESSPASSKEATIAVPTTEPKPRHSSRQSKPIDRFSSATYQTPASKLPAASPVNKTASPPSAPPTTSTKIKSATPSKKRKSTTPSADKVAKVKLDNLNGRASAAYKEESREKSGALETLAQDDEESVRLARELAGESFGLRRRRSLAG